MRKFFLMALLVALMNASTVFAAMDAGFTFNAARNQTFLSQGDETFTAKATVAGSNIEARESTLLGCVEKFEARRDARPPASETWMVFLFATFSLGAANSQAKCNIVKKYTSAGVL